MPEFEPGQKVVLSSYQQISTSAAQAMLRFDKVNLAKGLQAMGVKTLKDYKLHVGSVGTVKTSRIGDYTEVSFGKDRHGSERILDLPTESLTELNKKSFFTLVIPGLLGLK